MTSMLERKMMMMSNIIQVKVLLEYIIHLDRILILCISIQKPVLVMFANGLRVAFRSRHPNARLGRFTECSGAVAKSTEIIMIKIL